MLESRQTMFTNWHLLLWYGNETKTYSTTYYCGTKSPRPVLTGSRGSRQTRVRTYYVATSTHTTPHHTTRSLCPVAQDGLAYPRHPPRAGSFCFALPAGSRSREAGRPRRTRGEEVRLFLSTHPSHPPTLWALGSHTRYDGTAATACMHATATHVTYWCTIDPMYYSYYYYY